MTHFIQKEDELFSRKKKLANGQKCMQDYRQLQASVIFNQYLNNSTIS